MHKRGAHRRGAAARRSEHAVNVDEDTAKARHSIIIVHSVGSDVQTREVATSPVVRPGPRQGEWRIWSPCSWCCAQSCCRPLRACAFRTASLRRCRLVPPESAARLPTMMLNSHRPQTSLLNSRRLLARAGAPPLLLRRWTSPSRTWTRCSTRCGRI